MTFWQDPRLEPKRQYKFILSIPGGANTRAVSEFLIKKVKKPSWNTTETEHKFLNHSFWYPGRTTWDALDVTVVDTIDPTANATQQIMHILEESGYSLPTEPGVASGWNTVSKVKSVRDGLGRIKIKTLDADGGTVEEWVLNNAWVQKADFGEYSYDTEEIVEVSMTLRFDNAYVNVIQGDGPIPFTSTS
jgi:hypothetical protein